MLCLAKASFLFSATTKTSLSISAVSHRFTLPLLADPTPPFSFSTSWLALKKMFLHPSTSPLCASVPSQLSPVTLANQTESSGLMRLLGVAFPGEKDKEQWESEQEEARRRDHRRIGTVRLNLV